MRWGLYGGFKYRGYTRILEKEVEIIKALFKVAFLKATL